MIDPRLLDMLKNPDAAKRKAAIQALARSKDIEAIPYLQRVVDYDEDESIRDIAEKAVVYITRNNPDAPSATSSEVKHMSDESNSGSGILAQYEPEPIRAGPVVVNPAEAERARRLLSTALDLNMRGQDAKATKAVIDAFKANPNLKNDGYARSVASTATGLNIEEAVQKVLDGSAMELFEPKKPVKGKSKRGGSVATDSGGGDSPAGDDGRGVGEETKITFGSAFLDLIIMGIISGISVVVTWFVINYVILPNGNPDILSSPLFNNLPDIPNLPRTLGEYIGQLNGATPEALFVSALLDAGQQIVSVFIYTGLIHWVVTTFFGGEGSFSEMLHRFSIFTIIIGVLSTILGLVFIFMLVSGGMQGTDSVLYILGLPGIALGIYSIWGLATRIGATYEVGTGKGCMTIIATGVVAIIFICIISYAISYFVINQQITGLQ